MKFLIDMPVSPRLAEWLSAKGHAAVHASAILLHNAPDEVILEVARSEGRVVVTADLDYPRLLAKASATGPGLILFRGGSFSDAEIRSRLEGIIESMPEVEIAHSIVVIERWRVRRRRLPVDG